jgi:hypothetical protein
VFNYRVYHDAVKGCPQGDKKVVENIDRRGSIIERAKGCGHVRE